MKKKEYVFLSIAALAIFMVGVLLVLSLGDLFRYNDSLYQTGEAESVDNGPVGQERVTNDQASKVGGLVGLLPYSGSGFIFDYDFSKEAFVLKIKSSSPTEANMEFDEFLKQNGVLDRDWIQNLNTEYY